MHVWQSRVGPSSRIWEHEDPLVAAERVQKALLGP